MLIGKYINKYYLKYAIFFIIGIAALILVDIAQLYVPEYLGNIVNLLEDSKEIAANKDKIIAIIIKVVIVAAVMFVGRMIWRFTLFHASQKIEASLRHEMFLKSERLSQRYYHENKVGTIMSWFTTDLETIEEFFGWGTIMLIDALFLSVFVIVKMVMLEPVLSCISFVPIILIVVWGLLVEKWMSKKWETRQEAYDQLYDFSQENFTGIRVIKAFVRENKEIHAFAKIAKKNKDVNISFMRVSVLFDSLITIIIAIIFGIVLGFGGWFAYSTITNNPITMPWGYVVNLDAGKLITFAGYFDLLIWPMIALGQIISMRSRAKASLKRITRFLDEKEEVKDSDDPIILENVQGNIEFNHFSFAYPGNDFDSLSDINLSIKAGEKIGVVGKIGCGKTTLVNSLLRLYNVENDSIKIDGQDIMMCSSKSIRDSIAYVPQDNFLFSDKIKNNIAFYDQDVDSDKVVEAAKFADVDNDIQNFNDGYETISGERGVTLSGGQKQRISIARAFIKNSPILILDDSVSAVDVKTEETILHNVNELRKDKTTIIVASRVSTVSHLDKIIVLNDGKLEAFDTPHNLLKISPTYQKMVQLQELEKEVEGGNK